MTAIPREELDTALRQKVIAAGLEPEPFIRRLEQAIAPLPDPRRALTNLVRFLEAGFSSTLLREFKSHPVLLQVLLELLSQSQYLSDILVRHPEWLRWLTATGELQRRKRAEEFRAEARSAMAVFDASARKRDALKRFHRREILRIGAMDILDEASLPEIVTQLSLLAEVTIDEAVAAAFRTILPSSSQQYPRALSVIGLGKLGGGELNFSSDIDLMFVYEEDNELDTPVGRIQTAHELYVRIAEFVVEYLSGFSGEGYFYRVDMRLRPDGRSGPLALSRSGFRTYYESRGEQWERQMLIKARCVGGDRTVGDRFLADIRPFVFRRTLLTSPWNDIASMKRAIEEEFRTDENIKLGAGGIRDIEFLVQGLQLVHGGNREELRSSNTLRTLEALGALGIIPEQEVTDLRDAYVLFRDVEHRLQLFHGFQTHELPAAAGEYALLARKLGFSPNAFRRQLRAQRERVRTYFLSATQGMTDDNDHGLTSDERGMMESFRTALDRPTGMAVLKDVRQSALPAAAARRIGTLLQASATSAIVRQACSTQRLRSDLIRSVSSSSMIYERLSTDPLLLESLIGQAQTLLKGKGAGWGELLEADPARFKRYNEVRSAIRFLTGRMSLHQFETELTGLAETVVGQVAANLDLPDTVLVVGAGKLGSAEMGISSDLDLLLFFDEASMESDNAQRIGKSFAAGFVSPSKIYDVDMRLRPEGRNAPLVSGLAYLDQYMRSRAEPWEAMALKRSRVLWGTPGLRRRFMQAMLKRRPISAEDLVTYVRTMRERMEKERGADDGIDLKVGTGGIVDIEFIAQAGLLLQRRRGGRSTVAALRSLRTAGTLRQREVHILAESLAFLRSMEMIVRLNSPTSGSTLRPSSDVADVASAFIGASSGEELFSVTRRRMSSVRRIFASVLDRWERGG